MINKQNLWFLTLFSLILVLSIYYITMPDNLLKNISSNNDDDQTVVNVTESESLTALRVAEDEQLMKEMNDLQQILLDESKTPDEKSEAYDSLKELNLNKGKEEAFEKKILETYNLKSFVKIKNDQVKVTVASDKHDDKLANNIIRLIQSSYDKQMYITVKFQK